MARCEDFPCCGHEAGDCPRQTDDGPVFRCCECGADLPKRATSSICRPCQREANQRFAETGEMWPDADGDSGLFYGGY